MRLSKFKYLSFLLLGLLILPAVCSAVVPAVKLNTWTSASQGYAGSTKVLLTGSGFLSTPTAANVTVAVAATCGGAPLATTTASTTKHILGSSNTIGFQIPASLATGTYQVSATDTASGEAFGSSNCSSMKVLPAKIALSSCVPGASMGILTQGTNVAAYVPNGAWYTGNTGINVVPVEGTGIATNVPTGSVVNSCSSNSVTGTTVCTANDTNVYVLTGSAISNTVTTNSDTYANFSGGSCMNCGVAIDAVNNRAYVQMGLSTAPSGTALQVLDSTTGAQVPPITIPLANQVAENIQVDPGRGLIFSPNEFNNYDLVTTGGSPAEYGMQVYTVGEFDSAAEDCTTGIAVATQEFTGNLFITDVTQASFGTNTWSAPGQSINFPEFDTMSAGTSGIAVAPGSHLAMVSGEFGGNQIGVVTLPSASVTGPPTFGPYVSCNIPNDQYGNPFSAGYDPHTITAYVSPNDGQVYGVLADWYYGSPSALVVVNMQALLGHTYPATNTCDPAAAAGDFRYIYY